MNPDSAHLHWLDDGFGIYAASVICEDEGMQMHYSFALTADGYVWNGDDELITGPRPATFRSIDQAKAWAAQTEFKWRQSMLADTTPKEGGDAL